MHSSFHPILDIVFPSGLKDYFELTGVTTSEEQFDFQLQEINNMPEQYRGNKLTSKGFFDEVTIQDFPIRGCRVFYHIRRRRWFNEDTGKIVYRDWNMVAKGTRITNDFAAFLKEIGRYQGTEH